MEALSRLPSTYTAALCFNMSTLHQHVGSVPTKGSVKALLMLCLTLFLRISRLLRLQGAIEYLQEHLLEALKALKEP
jgi:hypothetical protein